MITFKKTPDPENTHHSATLTMEIPNDIAWPDLLRFFEEFMRGAGYYFDGTLDIVKEEEDEIPSR